MRSDLGNFLKNVDKKKLSEAIAKAKILAENPDIKKAFGGADKEKLLEIVGKLDDNNKNEVLNALINSDNKAINELLKKIRQ